jgi:hypothetical protein
MGDPLYTMNRHIMLLLRLADTRRAVESLLALQHAQQINQLFIDRHTQNKGVVVLNAHSQMIHTQEVNLQEISKHVENFKVQWRSQRIMIPGFKMSEWDLKIVSAEDEKVIVHSSDVSDHVDTELLRLAVEQSPAGIENKEKRWAWAAMVSHPSDQAFDVISDIIERHLPL